MQKLQTKLIDFFLVSLASLILMAYGWSLGQLHKSGYDVAGIFLFITGMIGLMLAFLVRYFTRKFSWYNTWYANLLTGMLCCVLIFVLVLLLARLHG